MKTDLYSSTRGSAHAHSEQRTENRRLAVLASIRATRNVGRVWNVVAVGLGIGIAALLSGFNLWAPRLSAVSITASLVVTIAVAWSGAALLSRPASGVVCFALPIVVGLACAGIAGQWLAFGVLLGCVMIPIVSLAVFHTDGRRT